MKLGHIEQGENSPLLVDTTHAWSSPANCYVLIFKATVGTGLVALPFAFRKGGLLPGLALLVVSWVLTDYSSILLVKECKRSHALGAHAVQLLEYHEIGFHAWGSLGKYAIAVCLMFGQYVAAASYIVFMDEIISPLVESPQLVIPVLTLIQLLLSMIPSLSSPPFKYVFCFGNLTLVIGCLLVLHEGIVGSGPAATGSVRHSTGPNRHNDLFISFGICSFLFATQTEIVSILHTAGSRAKRNFTAIVRKSLASVFIFYLCFGYVCYHQWGDDTKAVIFNNMARGPKSDIAKACVVASVITSTPLILEPFHRTLESFSIAPEQRIVTSSWKKRLLRACSVVSVGVISLCTKNQFGLMCAVGGGVAGVTSFIFPPLLSLKLNPRSPSCVQLCVAVSVVGFGLLASVGAIVEGLGEMVRTSQPKA